MKMTNSKSLLWQRAMARGALFAVLTAIVASLNLVAQSFSSGSDGSDGALTLAPNLGTIVFDPFEQSRWGRVLDPDGDGVYNFTTITIGSGTTLKLRGDKVNRPMYWLASGDVVISGTLDLSGARGIFPMPLNDLDARRQVAIPGPGGYAGGAGGRADSPRIPATAGEGPGGGSGGIAAPPCPLPQGSNYLCGKGGTFSGNRFLVPLVGGSGGSGSEYVYVYEGGGAGGGAILIASSTSITVNGQINAAGGNGGTGPYGGGGSGGAIRLVAPTVTGTGNLNVSGGSSVTAGGNGGSGWVRLEFYQLGPNLSTTPSSGALTKSSPLGSSTLKPASSIRVTAIDGVAVPTNPSGSFQFPDVTISKGGAVNVDVQAAGIPPGTVVTLQIYPETPADSSIVNLPTAQAMLTGTLQSSSATVAFTFPFGFSRGWVRASWTQ